jgi:glycine cleavage system aminomethyltransferase T
MLGWHVENGGQMVGFGGWDMPVKYGSSINDEVCVVLLLA